MAWIPRFSAVFEKVNAISPDFHQQKLSMLQQNLQVLKEIEITLVIFLAKHFSKLIALMISCQKKFHIFLIAKIET